MTKLAYRDDQGVWLYWDGSPRPQQGIEGDLFQIPSNAAETYSWQKLRSFGLYLVTSDPVPDGKAIVASELLDVDGKPHEALILGDIPEPEPQPFQLYRSTIVRRLDGPGEAETVELVLAGGDARLRLLWNTCDFFMSNDPEFAVLEGAFVAAFGATRAAELLAA